MKENQLKHIVFIQIIDNNETTHQESIGALKSKLEKLPSFINEIISLEVGRNISDRSNFDLSLTVVVKDVNDLNIYRNHSEHVKVLDFMKTLTLKTAVVDYIF